MEGGKGLMGDAGKAGEREKVRLERDRFTFLLNVIYP